VRSVKRLQAAGVSEIFVPRYADYDLRTPGGSRQRSTLVDPKIVISPAA